MIDEIILAGRQTGRTTELIKKAAENHKYIVCCDLRRAHFIANMARDFGLNIPFPVTIQELPIRSRWIDDVYIDDADILLQYIIGKHISCITMEKPVSSSEE